MRRKFLIYLLTLSSGLFISFPQIKNIQISTLVFEDINIEHGLPENSVTCILQDYLGYLWLGTQNGLVRYDGYTMKVFKPQKDIPGSISSGVIVKIYEDNNKNLWIGTYNGLNKFNRAEESFKIYRHDQDNPESINSDLIIFIYEDLTGRFWVGTDKGLNLFDQVSDKFSRYYFQYNNSSTKGTPASGEQNNYVKAIIQDPMSDNLLVGTAKKGLWELNVKEKTLSEYKFDTAVNPSAAIGWIQSFCKSRDGKIWMASLNTLSCLNPERRSFKSYIQYPIKVEGIGSGINSQGSVIEDKNGLIWAGFSNGEVGVFCLEPAQEIMKQYKLLSLKQKLSYLNSVLSLYEDNSGVIWIGTLMQGLKKLDKRKNNFNFLKYNYEMSSEKTSQADVYSVTFDPQGFIWYCTSNGLVKYDIKNKTYKSYLRNEKFISKDPYMAIIDKSGHIWLGVGNTGLLRFSPADNSHSIFLSDNTKSSKVINRLIVFLYQDRFGFLWIATEGDGLYKYSITENKISHYEHDPDDPFSLSQDQLRSIFEDSSGDVWIGTNLGGLSKFNRETDNFTHYGFTCVMSLYEDKQGNFWVGDYFTGLTLFDREKGIIIESYNRKDGFQSQGIYKILEDDHNNLWLGTEKGLTKFNINTKSIKHYHKEDGLQEDWFEFASQCYKREDGTMFFNTRSGIVFFHPDSIREDPVPPQVVLSALSLFNRPDEKLNYDGFIADLKEITLPYDQNDLHFEYVGLHYSDPSRNSYKYKLENFDNDWVDAGSQRNATYTNLDPGEYIFRVTASNKDGVWNTKSASVAIIITPPWWKTTTAYLLYLSTIIGIIYLTWKVQLKRIRIKNAYEMSRFEADKMHEIDEIKSRFFTNISHEFRTPLTLILGPVKQIAGKIKDEKIKEELNVIHRNARKLLTLVNQLLDISKIESGNMKLLTTPQNIIPLLKALFQSFCSHAERKKITLKFNSDEEEIIAYIDREKTENIITNILSNAFKFTPEGGRIELAVTSKLADIKAGAKEGTYKTPAFVEISISDTGIGIPKEKIVNIFDRFFQVDGSHKREQEGTGIGLALTKELVELHKGTIKVESIEGKGTAFTIRIPLGRDHLKQDEIIDQVIKEEVTLSITDDIITDKLKTNVPDIDLALKDDKKVLLIVEDNPDVRNYIKGILTEEFKVLEAENGEDGWNKSSAHMPDLIISDLMMPKMDGFELCNKIKSDERTSHIPVIMLTAKATVQDKIVGYKTGADDYIMKPFEQDELMARVRNLIEQRERIHDHFRKHGLIELDESEFTDVDKKFLQKVFTIIEENISNTSFNVEALAEKLAVHRVLLHKKIVSLTGEAPVEFIRRIRLKKAAELIEKKFGNITEIAYEVGFTNPAYFSECFKKQFGVSPSRYTQNR
jgi:signal transduction histidine kinase/ligand-binding sensor domain-containing protein/DNA-binding response OmpR family regulator